MQDKPLDSESIAVIGMMGRFPGAPDLETFWSKLKAGTELIDHFSSAQLSEAGVAPQRLDHPNFVGTTSLLPELACFDADFFGFTPKEAEITDPQLRVFLESAWHALEHAGYDPEKVPGLTGVFAGMSRSAYPLRVLATAQADWGFRARLGNDIDTLATWISYKLNLRGPSLSVQTACSTSLVAVHLAVQSLLNGECDMALAGGVSITHYDPDGYIHQEGGILSPDGHCRPFDRLGRGTLSGNGVGLVVLKRLDQAVADGDSIYAVIRGTAINNDGADKIGFTAPSLTGQAAVIRDAMAVAGVDPRSVSYVEAHGTATPLGDPIEVAALTAAFPNAGEQYCGIGSVKSNLGHLDAAAGVTGLIKAILSLHHRQLPPSIHFQQPNPEIDFANSPFYVVNGLKQWQVPEGMLRAGVSSFGIGGTNAHVVLEQAPAPPVPDEAGRPVELLVFSAKTETSLRRMLANMHGFLANRPQSSLPDIAATLRHGRTPMPQRAFVTGTDRESLCSALAEHQSLSLHDSSGAHPPVVFMFSGQGSQHSGMIRELYAGEPLFRSTVDNCLELAVPRLGEDFREALFTDHDGAIPDPLMRTEWAQPALFIFQYALARLWSHWGIRPRALIGHSVGEFTAACIANVMDWPDGLDLVLTRGSLMQGLPEGAMLSAALSEEALRQELSPDLSIAAINGPQRCVASGPVAAIQELEARLSERGIAVSRLHTSHAFHSPMMEPVAEVMATAVSRLPESRAPEIPMISGVTGTWMTAAQISDPGYWCTQLRQPVRFADGLAELMRSEAPLLVEIGPRDTLTRLARVQGARDAHASVGDPRDPYAQLMHAAGYLWSRGCNLDWNRFDQERPFVRVALPPYPFARDAYLIEAPQVRATTAQPSPQVTPAATPEPAASPDQSRDRRPGITQRLKEILNQTFGFPLEEIDTQANFYELGVDSLLMLQVTNAIRAEFGFTLPHRTLISQYPSLDKLAAYLATQLPPEEEPAAPEPETLKAQPPAEFPTPNPPDGPKDADLKDLFDRQLRIIQDQLDLLKGIPQGSAPPAVATTSPDPKRQAPQARGQSASTTGAEGTSPVLPFKPATRSGDQQRLNPAQSAFIEAFAKRFTDKTRESKRRTQATRLDHADARNASGFRREWKPMLYRIMVDRAEGARLWDVDGNEYVDITLGFGVHYFGHNAGFIRRAIEDQLEGGSVLGPQSDAAGEAAALIKALTGVERVAFTNTGTEGIMNALRMARAVTGRVKVVTFIGAYHGTYDGVLTRPKWNSADHEAIPLVLGTTPGMVADNLLLEYGTPESLAVIEAMQDEIAAVLVEPVQSRRPDFFPIDFLQALRRLTQTAGICLIFDEVVTGFRSHPSGVQALCGVQADLVVYGKVLGGGMPVGVVAGKQRFMDAIDGGYWSFDDDSQPTAEQTLFAGTFCKHPLTLAAMIAVLRHLTEAGPALQERTNQRTQALVRDIETGFHEAGLPVEVVRFGSQFRLRFPREIAHTELLEMFLIDRGVYGWEGGNYFLSTVHTDEDLAFIRAAFRRVAADFARFRSLGKEGTDKIPTAAPTKHFPLISDQRKIWAACKLAARVGVQPYNDTLLLPFRGLNDHQILAAAVHTLVSRHEALRTTISPDGQRQILHDQMALEIPFTDLSNAAAAEEALSAICRQEQHRPLDLEKGPLLRVHLVRRDPAQLLLVLTVHHIMLDAQSSATLFQELTALVSPNQLADKPLPEPVPFSVFLQRLDRTHHPERVARAQAYWLAQFRELPPPLTLPANRDTAQVGDFLGDEMSLPVPGALVGQLRKTCQELGCTMFELLLAAFHVLIHRLSEQDDVVISVPATGQALAGDMGIVGYCLRIFPIRTRLRDNLTFKQFLTEVQDSLHGAFDHFELTANDILEQLPAAPQTHQPLFSEVYFNLEHKGPASAAANSPAQAESGVCKAYLDLDVHVRPDALNVVCHYRTALFTADRIRSWLDTYHRFLDHIATRPDALIKELQVERMEKPDSRESPPETSASLAEAAPATAVKTPSRRQAEQRLIEIWQQELQVERVGIHDNYFELFGDSIKAILVCASAEESGIAITPWLLLEHPTIVSVLDALEQETAEASDTGTDVDGMTADPADAMTEEAGANFRRDAEGGLFFEAREATDSETEPFPWAANQESAVAEALGEAGLTDDRIGDVYPLTFLQEGLLFHTIETPGSGAYISQLVYRYRGALDRQALERALARIVARHQVLRTTFLFGKGLEKPVQVVHREAPAPLETLGPDTLADDSQEALYQFLDVDARRGFPLDRPPLMRLTLIERPEDRWLMVWSFHHIILDGWCLQQVFEETLAFLAEEMGGEPQSLSQPQPFRDYVSWLYQQDHEKAEAYWQELLAGFEEPNSLGLDEATGDAPGIRVHAEPLGEQISNRLRAFASTHGLTLNTVFQGLWALCLSAYSDRDDVVFGAISSGRPHNLKGVEAMVGFFMTSIPVRVRISGQTQLAAWLRDLQKAQFRSRQNEYVALSRIKACSDLPAESPLFQSILVFENLPAVSQTPEPAGSAAQGQPSLEEIPVFNRISDPLRVQVFPGRDITLEVSCEPGRFREQQPERIYGHLVALIEQILDHPTWPLMNFSPLSAAERQRVLMAWNQTAAAESGQCVHQLFFDQAARTPHATALIALAPDGEQTLTYEELAARSSQLACRLRARGVGEETMVGLCAERSLEMMVGLFGILRAGAAYVPLEPDLPQDRLRFILEDAQLQYLVTSTAWAAALPAHEAELIYLDRSEPLPERAALPDRASPDNAIYMIYTSGSTGRPKGTVVHHRGVANLLASMRRTYALTPQDRILQKTSFAFDVSAWELFLPLAYGANLVLAEPGRHGEAQYLADTIRDYRISMLHFVPTVLHPFLELEDLSGCSSLRHVHSGGEAMTPELRDRFFARLSATLQNAYGPTETTITTSHWQASPDAPIIAIGKALENIRYYVLDRSMNPVPVWVPGELFIGGIGVARGYHGRPQATASAFLPDPFSGDHGGRVYRTGDRVRLLTSGDVQYLGRVDTQIKLHGFRIELAEIESMLEAHESVNRAAVLKDEPRNGPDTQSRGPRLVAFLEADPDYRESAVKAYLERKLPRYMIPALFLQVEAMPTLANGKLDRKKLAAMDPDQQQKQAAFVAPRTPLERKLAEIWMGSLKLERISIHDDFFQLGGDSIIAIQITPWARSEGLPFNPLILFRNPTIARLAEALEQEIDSQGAKLASGPEAFGWESEQVARMASDLAEAAQLDRDAIEDFYPLSPLQEGMLFHSLSDPQAYVNQTGCHLQGPLHKPSLLQAFHMVIHHYAVLRTYFDWQSLAEHVQVVPKAVDIPINHLSWRDLTLEQAQQRWQTFVAEDRRLGLDLGQSPVMRLTLIELADDSHFLLWTYNHILVDGWSWPIILKTLFGVYAAIGAGTEPDLPEIRPYRDYIAWLHKQDMAKAKAFWQKNLAGFTEPTTLLIETPQQAQAEAVYGTEMTVLAAATTAQITEFAQRNSLTLNTLFQGAWALLLRSYAGRDDVVYGTTTSGRPTDLEGMETMVGLFINTLPTRIRCADGEHPVAWLQHIQDAEQTRRQYEYTPLVKIQEWCEVPRGVPLFESMLAFENLPLGQPVQAENHSDSPAAAIQARLLETSERQHHPLFWTVFPGDRIKVELSYDARRFDVQTVRAMLAHLQAALVQMPQSRRLGEISLLRPEDRERLLVQWNATEHPLPELGVHEQFRVQAERTPDHVCLRFRDQELTYQALNHRADQVAQRLRRFGTGPETFIGLVCERSIEMVVGLYGILKAGAAYVPIEPNQPAARINAILEDARVPLYLTQARWQSTLPESTAQPLCLDSDFPDEDAASETPLQPAVDPDHPAYMIYTSGSTGKPKGVVISHRAIGNRIAWMQDMYCLTEADAVLQKTPFSFDVSVWEFLWPLLHGARLVVAEPNRHGDAAYLREVIAAEGITTLHFVPSMLRAFLSLESFEGCQSVRQVFCSGEALTSDLEHRFFASLDSRLHNLYGPTEAAVDVTYWPCPPSGSGGRVPIGRPIANTRLYILNTGLGPVPVGVPGELLLGGLGLARGYHRRPALTASVFIPDPFSGRPGARLYKTGDRARYLEDGPVEFLGRLDNQVKLRGFRIELGEIETVMRAHPGIENAAVLIRSKKVGGAQLVAFVQASSTASTQPDPEAVREFLTGRLPEYMVPSTFIFLALLPLTSSGKLNRAALANHALDQGQSRQAYQAPSSEIEWVLCDLWSRVLKVEKIGVLDNFFELGGDSIVAIQIAAQANRAGLAMIPMQLFDAPTIQSLAAVLEQAPQSERQPFQPTDDPDALNQLFFPDPDEREKIIRALAGLREQDGEAANPEAHFPIAPLQQGMLFQSLLTPNRGVYLNRVALQITGPLNSAALEKAFQRVCDHYQILRTHFLWETLARPIQVVRAHAAIPFDQLDWCGLESKELEDCWQSWIGEENSRGIALDRAPLMRVTLIRTGEQRWILDWTHHHIILDGWSLPIVFQAVLSAYRDCTQGKEPNLAPSQPYGDYVQWLFHQNQGEAEAYWRQTLAGFTEPSTFDFKLPPAAPATDRSFLVKERLSPETTNRLKAFAARFRLTENTLIQGAWALLIKRYSGRDDILFGVATSGRPSQLPHVDNMVGLFLNTLPFRTQVPNDATLADWLARIQRDQVEARQYQYSPLIDIQGWSDIPRGVPLFDNVLAFESTPLSPAAFEPSGQDPNQGVGLDGLSFDMVDAPGGNHFPFTLMVIPGEAMQLVLDGDGTLVDEPTAVRITRHLKTLLENFLSDPQQSLGAIPMLGDSERQQLLTGLNDTAMDLEKGRLLCRLFEDQVARTPDAPAVRLWQSPGSAADVMTTWTYDQLNRKANQLAFHLRGLGVGPEAVVGIFMERSPEALAAMWAVLKAGGGFLPLPPDLPAERLNFILRDSNLDILLVGSSLDGPGQDGPGLDGPGPEDPGKMPPIAEQKTRLIQVPSDWSPFAGQPEENPDWPLLGDTVAYVIYTSGSTGKPKGTHVTGKSLLNLCLWYNSYFSIGVGTNVLQAFSLAFDSSIKNMLSPLIAGGTTVLFPSGPFDPAFMAQTIETQRIHLMNCVPSMIYPVLELTRENGYKALESLRYLAVIGEVLNLAKVRPWLRARHCTCTLVNTYGPTEATDNNLAYKLPVEEIANQEPTMPLGTPVHNTRAYLVDRGLEPVPPGARGDLLLGGICVARGYANRPALTAEKFVPDPFAPQTEPGARLYKTGDMARYLSDRGLVDFIGRADAQVKIRGNRIELGEVEHALKAMTQVMEAVVLAPPGPDGNKRLVAYVVPVQASDGLEITLRHQLQETLPRYMLPEAFVFLPSLPLLPNGKLNRKALPDPDPARGVAAAQFEAPQSGIEQQVAALWQEILQLEKVGRNINFFDLGGHSLHLVALHARLRAALDPDLTLMDLFDMPTVQALARYLHGRRESQTASLEEAQTRAAKQKAARARKRKKQPTGR